MGGGIRFPSSDNPCNRLIGLRRIAKSLKSHAVALGLFALIAASALATLARRVDDVDTLRWAHVYETSSPYHQQALRVAEEFERRTQGRFRINVYPASSLGNEVAINESLGLGAIDIIYTGPSLVMQRYPPIAISEYPYAVDDYEHWKAYRDSDLFAEVSAAYGQATRRRVLSLVYYGFRHVTANQPIVLPSDMRGLKIRVPNSPMFLIMPESTSANATPMPFSEVYLALQQGVVDAQENPLTTILFKRFYEVQSHINLTGHMCNSLLTVVSQRTLQRLGPRDAAVFEELAQEGARRASDAIAEREQELSTWFRERGVVVVESDRSAFRSAIRPAYEGPSAIASREQYDRLRALVPK